MIYIQTLFATNSTGTGTNWQFNNTAFGGTNNWGGDVAYSGLSISSLATGVNADINVSTNVYCKISGPGAAFSTVGFNGARDGRILIIQYSGGFAWTVSNDSGLDPTAANRIYTGLGALSTIVMTNNPAYVQLIYDGGTTHWNVMAHSN